MYEEIPPLQPSSQGPEVAKLQEALHLLLDRGRIALDPVTRDTLLKDFGTERGQETFGDKATSVLVRLFQAQYHLPATGDVDAATANAINKVLKDLGALDSAPPSGQFIVRGQVTYASSKNASGLTVRAYDRDLRSEELLDAAKTDAQGAYQISYTADKFKRAEKGTADLVVRVYDAKEKVLAASPVRFNAGNNEVVDLVVPDPVDTRSELEIYLDDLEPVLGDVSLPELTSDDLDFLHGDTGIDRNHLLWMSLAAKCALGTAGVSDRRTAEIYGANKGAPTIPMEAFYGWFRMGLPTDLPSLWSRKTNELISALKTAIARRIIPAGMPRQLDAIAKLLPTIQVQSVLQPAPAGAKASLGDVLKTMPTALEPDKSETVANVVAKLPISDPKFSSALTEGGLSSEEAAGVERTLKLAQLTSNHVPLLTQLQKLTQKDADSSLRSLAAIPADQWFDMAYANGAPATSNLSEDAYADQLRTGVQRLQPSATLANRISEGSLPAVPELSDVSVFLKNNQNFDISTANLQNLPKDTSFDGVKNKATLNSTLLSLQRFQTLNTTWEESGQLLNAGIRGPMAIVERGPQQLRQTLSGLIDDERVDAIYHDAKAMHDLSMGIMAVASPQMTLQGVAGIPDGSKNVDTSGLQAFPTLQSLFGPLDSCACEDCLSVLSPSAYFVDLMKFVERSGPALDALLLRRPDILDLELSCDNSEIEIPYLDLVNETLENAVALPITIQLPAGTSASAEMAKNPLPQTITSGLARTALQIPQNLVAIQNQNQLLALGGLSWVVADRYRRWTLTSWDQSFALKFGAIIRNISLDGIDVPALITSLNNGQMSADFQQLVLTAMGDSAGGPRVKVGFETSVSTVTAGVQWKITVRQQILVDLNNKDSKIKFSDKQGKVVSEKTYSANAVNATNAALASGKAGGMLIPSLPAHASFKVTPTGVTGGYSLEGAGQSAVLTFHASSFSITSLAYQSTAEGIDLMAQPQNLNLEAYKSPDANKSSLSSAWFPWTLPFDLNIFEVRRLLERAYSSRKTLLELCRPVTRLTNESLAQEVLGLSPAQATRLGAIGSDGSAPSIWQLWGAAAAPGTNKTSIVDSSTAQTVSDIPLKVLSRVSILLQQSRVSLDELRAILDTDFVTPDPSHPLTIVPIDACSPSSMTIDGLDASYLDRIHRFVLLWRLLGWNVKDVDMSLSALGITANNLDTANLGLASIVRLMQLLSLPPEQLAVFWHGFNTRLYQHLEDPSATPTPSLYERLFQSRSKTASPDPDLALTGNRKEVVGAGAGATISAKLTTVSASIGASADWITKLLAPSGPIPDVLNLANLGTLYSACALLRTLTMTPDDYADARVLIAYNPFASPAATVAFAETVNFIKTTSFSLEDLRFLLSDKLRVGSTLDLSADDTLTLCQQVCKAASAVIDRATVAYVSDDSQIAAGNPGGGPLDAQQEATKAAQRDLKRQVGIAVVERLAGLQGADVDLMTALLLGDQGNYEGRLKDPADNTRGAVQVLLDQNFISGNTATAKATAVLRLLRKSILVCTTLDLAVADLQLLPDVWAAGGAGGGMHCLEFNALPLSPPAADVDKLFRDWRALATLLGIRDILGGAGATALAYVAALDTSSDAALAVLDAALGLAGSSARAAATRLAPEFNNMGGDLDFRDPIPLRALLDLLTAEKMLGANDTQVNLLIAPSPTADTAKAARDLLQMKYGGEDWTSVIKPITDELRRRRRDALVDYLVAQSNVPGAWLTQNVPSVPLSTANDLYEYYLIDVQMGSCMGTTRLLQGTAAIQLFVFRCLMNLEKNVSPSDIANRDQWDWMQNYRVWEANRKVFLFPENWLFPELRDDKSDPFLELEASLSENEVTDKTGREAYSAYLDELVEVSQIIVLGMHEHPVPSMGSTTPSEGSSQERILYVIGRSADTPFDYFWRQCSNLGADQMEWTPWETIDLDIVGEHVMIFVFGGDLHVAWPVITKINASDTQDHDSWEVQMAWARRTTRGWSKKKISRDKIAANRLINKDENQSWTFRVWSTSLALGAGGDGSILGLETTRIDCYAAFETQGQNQSEAPASAAPQSYGLKDIDLPQVSIAAHASWKRGANYEDAAGASLWLRIRGLDPNNAGDETAAYNARSGKHGPFSAVAHPLPFDQADVGNDNALCFLGTTNAAGELTYGSGNAIKWLITFQDIAPDGSNVLIDPTPSDIVPGDVWTGDQNGATMVALDVLVSHPDSTTTKADLAQTITFDPNSPPVQVCSLEFSLDPAANAGSAPSENTTREVAMNPVGTFFLVTGKDMYVVEATPNVPLSAPALQLISGTTSFANRMQQAKSNFPTQLMLQNVAVFDSLSGPGLFEVVVASSVHSDLPAPSEIPQMVIWNYRDDQAAYYLLTEARGASSRAQVFSESQTMLANERVQAALDLPTLFSNEAAAADAPEKLLKDYQPENIDTDNPVTFDGLAFNYRVPSSIYWWETFYHAPSMIAQSLSQHHRFDEARDWFHFIFDPTIDDGGTSASRYWRFAPFHNQDDNSTVNSLLTALAKGQAPSETDDPTGVRAQIARWRKDPFNPFAIARMRQNAFRWAIVFAYLDNLINWGDQLFQRFTRESINEATQLYVLASKILGPRPAVVTPQVQTPPMTYRALNDTGQIDDFSNAWISLADNPLIQSWLAFLKWLEEYGFTGQSSDKTQTTLLSSIGSLYFCIPHNDKLDDYWTKVEDRLGKIRSCRDIDGVPRTLALYDPPIDPAMLIRARAAGIDINDVLDNLYGPSPHYRFTFLLGKAIEITGEVKQFGAALLSALEKRDAEALALLRSGHEVEMNKLIMQVKQGQVDEAQKNVTALQQSEATALERLTQYQKFLGQTTLTQGADEMPIVEQFSMLSISQNAPDDFSGLDLTGAEVSQLGSLEEANGWAIATSIANTVGGIFHALPNFTIGTMFEGSTFGGTNLGNAANAIASALSAFTANAQFHASRASQLASYQRRREDWLNQSKLALEEIRQIRKQTIAAQARQSLAEQELSNHLRQIEQVQEVDEFLKDKFTSQQLYKWMADQLSHCYMRTYQLALEQAKRAERACQMELVDDTASFIDPSNWDNRRQGLLAGEWLHSDLKRMEALYLEKNLREFEITKSVSLFRLNPMALMQLRETGICNIDLNEEIFDVDYPGHYFRRIKSVSLTIPCVVGPYASVNCTLRLLDHSIRVDSTLGGGADPYALVFDGNGNPADPRFVENRNIPYTAIATSSGQNDSGMFELNFRDERFLPFEGAGAISSWELDLNGKYLAGNVIKDFSQFDFDTISDAILHIRYTSREDLNLRAPALTHLENYLKTLVSKASGPLLQCLDLRRQFASEWQKLTASNADTRTLSLKLAREHFPFLGGLRSITLQGAALFVHAVKTPVPNYTIDLAIASTQPGSQAPDGTGIASSQVFDTAPLLEFDYPKPNAGGNVTPLALSLTTTSGANVSITLAKGGAGLAVDGIRDAWLILSYSLT